MAFNKDVVMQKVQRFGGAMFTPVLMFGVFGIIVALSILCKNPMILGSIAEKGTAWYNFWYIIEQGAWTVFNQLPLLFVIGLPIVTMTCLKKALSVVSMSLLKSLLI